MKAKQGEYTLHNPHSLDNASVLRDEIDTMLADPMEEDGIRVSPLMGDYQV